MKSKFERIVKENIKRDGIDKLMKSIDGTDFYTAPASTRYHHSYEGGLVEHSIQVFNRLKKDWEDNVELNSKYTLESIAIVSLFHDLCKMGYYTTEMRNAKIDGKWQKVPYYTVDDLMPLGHGEKSVILLQEYIRLTADEILAIRWHMGLSVPKEEYGSMGKAFEMSSLALFLHFADMKSSYLDDKKE